MRAEISCRGERGDSGDLRIAISDLKFQISDLRFGAWMENCKLQIKSQFAEVITFRKGVANRKAMSAPAQLRTWRERCRGRFEGSGWGNGFRHRFGGGAETRGWHFKRRAP